MRVLGVGVATLDMIQRVADYPAEDSEVRALGQRRARGGNSANLLEVLRQLGHTCAWAGSVAEDSAGLWVLADLAGRGIDTSPCALHSSGRTPTSYITLSERTGSRTIVHVRDLPEYRAADFARLDLGTWDWVHFEGRAPEELGQMMERLRSIRPSLPYSLELEKPRTGLDAALYGPCLILASRAYALALGFRDAVTFLQDLRRRTSAEVLTCAWGEAGAWGMDREGGLWRSPSYPPKRVIDTVGAGDSFSAAVIDAIASGAPLREALYRGCRLAGRKCGQMGLEGLAIVREPAQEGGCG